MQVRVVPLGSPNANVGATPIPVGNTKERSSHSMCPELYHAMRRSYLCKL